MSVNNNFKIIYKILSKLEQALDYEEFNSDVIFSTLDISKTRYDKILVMLYNDGYITGNYIKCLDCEYLTNIEITLKGLEYLKENSTMKKIQEELTGVINIIK